MKQACGINGAKDKLNRVLVGKTWRKEITEKPRCRREDNIKIKLKGKTRDGMNWIHLLQNDKVTGTSEHGKFFLLAGELLASRSLLHW